MDESPTRRTAVGFVLQPQDDERLRVLCGHLNGNLKHLEQRLGVRIYNRGAAFKVHGQAAAAWRAKRLLQRLYETSARVDHLDAEQLERAYYACVAEVQAQPKPKVAHSRFETRTISQRRFVDMIAEHTVIFGNGPAGTGKTFLAVAMGLEALERGQVDRLILCRPLVEAGEKMGFLPGDMLEKVDPYLRPLLDALQQLAGHSRMNELRAERLIEVVPLAFMRGLSFNRSFVILDEAQNCSVAQMKMFLTRLGHGSKLVINGDPSQVDLPSPSVSGLVHACQLLGSIDGIGVCELDAADTVRHPLVAKMIDAYREQHDPTKD